MVGVYRVRLHRQNSARKSLYTRLSQTAVLISVSQHLKVCIQGSRKKCFYKNCLSPNHAGSTLRSRH